MKTSVTLVLIGLAFLLCYCLKLMNAAGGLGMLAGVIFIGVGVVTGIDELNRRSIKNTRQTYYKN